MKIIQARAELFHADEQKDTGRR